MQPVFDVRAHRTPRESARGSKLAKYYEGTLVDPPEVGQRLVIVRPGGTRMITSPVVRVLFEVDEKKMMYVETRNSVYRLWIGRGA